MKLKIKYYLSLVTFAHSIFSLPFALIGFFIGINTIEGSFPFLKLILIILSVLFARNAAMAFNRFTDRKIDALNPRTLNREIPLGRISPKNTLVFIIINATLFIFTSYLINTLCFYLSPLALIIIMSYSYLKRFTWLCHFVLGLSLSIAPIGAYIAVAENFALTPMLFSLLVVLWTSGFDIIYSLQDINFDQKHSLNSIPAKFGLNNALYISAFIHFLAICICWLIFLLSKQNLLSFIGTFIFSFLLIYQHIIVSNKNLSKINIAFFTTNGLASVVYAVFYIVAIYF